MISVTVFLLIFLLFSSFILGYLLHREGYDAATSYYLEHNHQVVVEQDIEEAMGSQYVTVHVPFIFKSFNYIETLFGVKESGFTEGANEVVYITDTGAMYHRPLCPTVDKSLHPMTLKEAEGSYSPCSICH